MMLLGLGACLLLSAMILMTMSVSGIYLEQRRLQRLADQSASLAGAKVEETDYYTHGVSPGKPLEIERTRVSERVKDYLAWAGPQEAPGLGELRVECLEVATTRVSLRLATNAKVPIPLPFISELIRVPLRAQGNAEVKASFG